MKKFIFISIIVIAFFLIRNLQEPYGIYAVVAMLVISIFAGALVGFFAYLVFVSFFSKKR
ncbi:MAG TPA: hypothetical protein VFK37_04200 [Bacillales bacterium]|nr:hypothetical protein [Bacillales bacterium]